MPNIYIALSTVLQELSEWKLNSSRKWTSAMATVSTIYALTE